VKDDLDTLQDCWYIKTQEVSTRGIPDILGCFGGTFVALELKTEKGKMSALQIHNMEKIIKAGGFAFEVKPTNWDHVFSFLKTLCGLENEGVTRAKNQRILKT
jgi:hypothetical protein